MKLCAVLFEDQSFKWTLSGAKPKTPIELRIQNLSNGQLAVLVAQTDQYGCAFVPYNTFGRHIAVTARVLTETEETHLHVFSFDKEILANHLCLTSQSTSAVAKRTERLANV